jgi:hypothetical protein
MNPSSSLVRAVTVLAFLALAAGSAEAGKPLITEPSGYLADYSQLEKISGTKYRKGWLAEDVDWKSYHGILVDPVELWIESEEILEGDYDPEDLAMLQDYLRGTFIRSFAESRNVQVVEEPGPGVLRLRLALTNLRQAKRGANVLTGFLVKLPFSLGGAALEGELRDSDDDRLLLAFTDQSRGKHVPSMRAYTRWGHAKKAMDRLAADSREFVEDRQLGVPFNVGKKAARRWREDLERDQRRPGLGR